MSLHIPSDIEMELCDFLLSREEDIALDIENFGYLKNIFRHVFKRDAKESGV